MREAETGRTTAEGNKADLGRCLVKEEQLKGLGVESRINSETGLHSGEVLSSAG